MEKGRITGGGSTTTGSYRINKRRLGAEKEALVTKYLEEQGYQVMARNFFTRYGELDIVARHEGYLVFIEVKYRSGTAFGAPEEAVTYYKQKHLISAAKYYLLKNGLSFEQPIRFDVVAMLGEEIRIVENAFQL